MHGFPRHYGTFAFGILAAVFVGVAVAIALPFLPALLWANVLAILTQPVYNRARAAFNRKRLTSGDRADTLASLSATLFTLLIILLPFLMIGAGLFVQFSDVASQAGGRSVDEVIAQVDTSLRPVFQRFGQSEFALGDYFRDHRNELVGGLKQPATILARQAGTTILTLVVALLTQFFLLRDAHRLREPAVELIGLARERTIEIFDRVAETVRAVFVGTVLVAMIQGAVIGVAYAFAGVPNALLLAVVSAVLCIIPLLGAPVVYLPVGLALLAQGNVKGAMIVLLTGFIIVSNIDNVLKPYFIGGRTNLHPMAIFFSILGGVALVGPIGVMAGPMALTILLALIEILRERLRVDAGAVIA